jgi:hypothetical protein
MLLRSFTITVMLVVAVSSHAAVTLTVDNTKQYQTITGWEAVAFALEPHNPAFPNFKDALFDLVVNDLGINRVRLEIRSGVENNNDNWSDYQAGKIDYETWRSRRYANANDNDDPLQINWSGFHFSEMDHTIDNIVLPLKQLLQAKGGKLHININYVAFTGQIKDGGIYIHDDPDEYAEFVLATYHHLQSEYGWVPDSWEVILEPDNVSQWNGNLIGHAIVAAANRLTTDGFTPVFVAPSNTNMARAITYFDQMIQVPGVLQFLREFSYHRYGGVSIQNLQTIASKAEQHGINTSMLEWWNNGNSYLTLHEDLKTGNNSAWQQGVIAGALNAATCLYKIDDSDPANPKILINDTTKFTRQYYKFVRPGAVRIEATSSNGSFDPLAFINTDGKYVVVVKADAGGSFSIRGLPAGTYGIKYTTSREYDVDLPDITIGGGKALTTSIPMSGVLTVYARETGVGVNPLDKQPTRWAAIKRNALLANYPNPFNPETWIPYQLAVGTDVRIQIYDIVGRLVRSLDLGYQSAGNYLTKASAAHWDGRTESSDGAASGIYWCHFKAGDFVATRKMVLAK